EGFSTPDRSFGSTSTSDPPPRDTVQRTRDRTASWKVRTPLQSDSPYGSARDPSPDLCSRTAGARTPVVPRTGSARHFEKRGHLGVQASGLALLPGGDHGSSKWTTATCVDRVNQNT